VARVTSLAQYSLQGSNDDIIVSGFLRQYFDFLKRKNLPVDLTPIVAAHIMNKVPEI
jgi:CTP:phosphocholine cytidylyltransferase-like protein